MNRKFFSFVVLLVCILKTGVLPAQIPALTFDLKKPQKFENRKLGSEKNVDKKFTAPRRFMQNTITHYNYYFNANEKIKEIVARAKTEFKDDYTQLLPFYNYTLDATSKQKQEIDSVLYKATAGILLHDLRNSWIDNLYLLMGQAYHYRKDFDSALQTFQFVNYAFSPKEKDGYDKVIGSNSNENGNVFSIATKEKNGVVQKVFSTPPSRNESFIWQIKNYLANNEIAEAAGMIQTLKTDPVFPARLYTDLEEVQAYYFYKQEMYDSAAVHLEKALPNATDQQERARWEYLIAQLHERSKNKEAAKEFYGKAIRHTIDPVLEVYALLNNIRQDQGNDAKALQNAIDDLLKMARRDKYLNYRDIIYYTAAQMELDRNNKEAARGYLAKSVKYSINNPLQKSASFLQLGNMAFTEKEFLLAKNYYDSVDASLVADTNKAVFTNRKEALGGIALHQGIITRQDSLQTLARLPQTERDVIIKRTLKQLRKAQGLKDEEPSLGAVNPAFAGNNNIAPADIFNTNDKGDWYFYNNALKSRGATEFKAKWGSRPNVDNWRRSSLMAQQQLAQGGKADDNIALNPALISNNQLKELSFESLLSNLPLTEAQLKTSNDSILQAQFNLGMAFQEGLEDYNSAVAAYEKLLQRFPSAPVEEATLFNLYYCYKKLGDVQRMAQIKRILETRYSNGKLTAIIKNPAAADTLNKEKGARLYDEIYTQFIEGNFEAAIAKKKLADSLYGKSYWTPQLLYIQAVYHIKERDDVSAADVLGKLVNNFQGTPMSTKAQNLLNVLSRRQEIEDYLTKLQIERPKEDTINTLLDTVSVVKKTVVTPQPPTVIANKQADNKLVTAVPPVAVIKKDTVQNKTVQTLAYTHNAAQQHLAVLVMDKVDPVYVNEAKNAFVRYHRERYYNQALETTPLMLTDDIRFLTIGKFADAAAAADYVDKTKKLTATDIIPWMPAAKYSFVIITEANLELLKNRKDLPDYKKFIQQYYPGL
jgi:Tetratricopeptide repeat